MTHFNLRDGSFAQWTLVLWAVGMLLMLPALASEDVTSTVTAEAACVNRVSVTCSERTGAVAISANDPASSPLPNVALRRSTESLGELPAPLLMILAALAGLVAISRRGMPGDTRR